MKKTKFIAVLSVLAAATAFGAACNQKECKHDEWQTKSGNGFHYLECADCGEKKDYALHVDEKNNETQENGADGKCDVCGADVDLNNVSYDWKYDDENHWIEIDGNKTGSGGHFDADNDGKCDTCGKVNKIQFIFDYNGKLENNSVAVEHGSAANQPADPQASGWVFDGWYKDAECKTAYDFSAPVTGATTVYAKWNADTIPGYNPAYPIGAELDTEKTMTFGKAEKLYFKYTAPSAGRYSVSLIALDDKCTIATDLDGDKHTVKDDGVIYFDLAAKESVVVEVTRGAEVNDSDLLIVYFSSNVNEPLPASWAEGEYVAGEYEFILNKTAKTIVFTYESDDPVSYSYVGGNTDILSFSYADDNYTAAFNDEDYLVIKRNGNVFGNFKYYVPDERIPLSQFEGYYQPVSGNAGDKDKLIDIAFDGQNKVYYTVRLQTRDGEIDVKYTQTFGEGSTFFYTKSSTAVIDSQYYTTLNFDEDGNVESVTVTWMFNGTAYVYERVSDMTPVNIPVESGERYAGYLTAIVGSGEKSYWNSTDGTAVSVTAFDKSENVYTVTRGSETFKLKFEEANGEKTLYLYDEEGENLIDTLNLCPENIKHDLPDAETETKVNAAVEEFKLKTYYMTAKTAGWYKFSANIDLQLTVNGVTVAVSGDMDALLIEANAEIAFTVQGDAKPESVEISVTKVDESQAPAGSYESAPAVIDNVGEFVQTGKLANTFYYYEFTAPEAGDYLLSAYYKTSSGSSVYSGLEYYLNGSDQAPKKVGNYVQFSLEQDGSLKVKIKTTVSSLHSFVLRFEKDCTKGTEISFNDDGKGTFSAGGEYYCADFTKIPYAAELVIGKADGEEFDITVNGEKRTVKTYSLTPAQVAHGFVLSLGDNTVEYAITYASGAKQNPVEIKETGALSQSVMEANRNKYFKITAPEDKDCVISITGEDVNLTVDGTAQESYKLAKGTTVTVAVNYTGSKTSAIFDLNVFYDFTAAQELKLADFNSGDNTPDDGMCASYKLIQVNKGESLYYIASTDGSTLTINGYSSFTVINGNTEEYATKGKDGQFSVIIPAGEKLYFKITSEKVQDLTLVLSYPIGVERNPYQIKFEEGVSSSVRVSYGKTVYIKIPEYGTFSYNNSNYGTLYLNGNPVKEGELFTATAGEVVKFVANATRDGVVILTYTVNPELVAKYSYDDGESVLKVTPQTVVIGEKTYTLTSMAGDNYTFTADKDSVVLTLSEDVISFGDKELTRIPMFTEDMAQSYKGKANWGYVSQPEVTLTLTQNGKASFSGKCENFTFDSNYVYVTDNDDGSYTFPYSFSSAGAQSLTAGTITFSFGMNGTISLTYTGSEGNFYGHTMKPETPFDPFGSDDEDGMFSSDVIGEYKGLYDTGWGTATVTLAFNKKGNGTFNYFADYTITITDNGGTYSFMWGADMDKKATFSLNADGTITLVLDGKNATLSTMFSAAVAGEYKGSYDPSGWGASTVTLTFDRNGSGTFNYFADYTITITDNGGTYSFMWGADMDKKATFTVNADGSVALVLDGNSVAMKSTNIFSADVIGEYKGSYDPWGWGGSPVSLVFDKKGNGTFTYFDDYTITITDKGSGTYSFMWGVKMDKESTFSLNADGTITLVLDGSNVALAKA